MVFFLLIPGSIDFLLFFPLIFKSFSKWTLFFVLSFLFCLLMVVLFFILLFSFLSFFSSSFSSIIKIRFLSLYLVSNFEKFGFLLLIMFSSFLNEDLAKEDLYCSFIILLSIILFLFCSDSLAFACILASSNTEVLFKLIVLLLFLLNFTSWLGEKSSFLELSLLFSSFEPGLKVEVL